MISGGHAIMLELELPKEIEDLANQWVREAPERRKLPESNPHMTLLFVGRDLFEGIGEAMIRNVRSMMKNIPKTVSTSGPIKMFGAKRDHLAVLLSAGDLSTTRALLKHKIEDETGITIKDGFGFNPHVSVGVGGADDTVPITNLRRYSLKVTNVIVKIGSSLSLFPVI